MRFLVCGLKPPWWVLVASAGLWPALAAAQDAPHEPVHVVERGDTIGRIAKEYKVSEQAIRTLNGIRRGEKIKPGQKITVPAPDEDPEDEDRDKPAGREQSVLATSALTPSSSSQPGLRALAGHRRGVVRFVRGTEMVQLAIIDRRHRLNPAVLPGLANVLRYTTGATHKIDPRLAVLLALVSDHFGGRDIIVVSGYRPYSPSQYTRQSNHNIGRAVDFVVRGVSNERVRDFCRTLRNTGVGYYPNSSFVHLDVRSSSAYWVDFAGPGQRPRYQGAEGGEADEGAGEVSLDVLHQTRLSPGDLQPSSEASRDGSGNDSFLRRSSGTGSSADPTGDNSVFPDQK